MVLNNIVVVDVGLVVFEILEVDVIFIVWCKVWVILRDEFGDVFYF